MLVLSVVISISKLVNEMNLICTGKQMSFLFDYAMIVTEIDAVFDCLFIL